MPTTRTPHVIDWRRIALDAGDGVCRVTIEQFAAQLNGREYGSEMTLAECELAKRLGFAVVFGASDDLLEFRGAIDDEIGCYGGTRVMVDPEGIFPDFEEIRAEPEETWEAYYGRKQRHGGGAVLESLWCYEPGYSWTFQTEIPHATFEVLEDGEPYCRGLVFRLDDARGVA